MPHYPEPPHEEPTNTEQLIALALIASGAPFGGLVLAVPVWFAINGVLSLLGRWMPAVAGQSVGFAHVWLYTSLAGFVLVAAILYGIQQSKRR